MKSFFTFLVIILSSFIFYAQSNQYLHFDGMDDYVSVDNIVSEITGSNQISMTGWFYTDALIYGGGMMGFRGGGDGDVMNIIQLSDGVVECRLFISGTMFQVIAPAGSAQAGVWQHFAWIYNGTTVELFIDGTSIGSATAGGTFNASDKPFGIGKGIAPGYNFVFKGRIDEVSLWNTGLTQAAIQDMINNELIGNESGLVAYYKFNQGIPGDDNTFITELFTETGNENGVLHNFALQGATSNFNGVLESDFQVINFPVIPNKVIGDNPFDLEAYTSSGLQISYTLESGPASISGSTVTLDGTVGEVVIKASQAGDATYQAAEDVYASFQVFDPATVLPQIVLTNPVPGDVFIPQLGPIPLAINASIEHADIFSIDSIEVEINGLPITFTNHDGTHYTAWWTPFSYGVQNVVLQGTNNYGNTGVENISFTIVETAMSQTVHAVTDLLLNNNYYTEEVSVNLPSYLGAYDAITATLFIDCPTAGCDPWDRVSHVHAQGHDGKWHEIIRYVTPYGVACQHEIDLTDFMSLLQGEIKLRFTLGTSGTGFLYSLDLDYQVGAPNYNYSTVSNLWLNTYAFGDLADLQPCEGISIEYNEDVEEAKIKLVSTGHGWGSNNTGNAAEFHHDIHNIWVDGVSTFSQDNWVDCNPNPDGCNPQNGTWYHDRAGWCPGAIAQWFDFNLGSVNTMTPMQLNYILDEDYVDYCHPNNPDCITGTTCSNCNDGFNPHLIVASHLVSFSDVPLIENLITLGPNEYENPTTNTADFLIYPNPNYGRFVVDTHRLLKSEITVFNIDGKIISQISSNAITNTYAIDISAAGKGIYFVRVSNEEGIAVKKIVKY